MAGDRRVGEAEKLQPEAAGSLAVGHTDCCGAPARRARSAVRSTSQQRGWRRAAVLPGQLTLPGSSSSRMVPLAAFITESRERSSVGCSAGGMQGEALG